MNTKLFTIGHSTRKSEELISFLRTFSIQELVDVRTVPRSRFNPQFNRDILCHALTRCVIDYRHMPELGGLRRPVPDSLNCGWRNSGFRGFADYMQTSDFTKALATLCGIAVHKTVVIMCAEAVPWRCHRSLIADALSVRGLKVCHILSGLQCRPHTLTPFARVTGTVITYPSRES